MKNYFYNISLSTILPREIDKIHNWYWHNSISVAVKQRKTFCILYLRRCLCETMLYYLRRNFMLWIMLVKICDITSLSFLIDLLDGNLMWLWSVFIKKCICQAEKKLLQFKCKYMQKNINAVLSLMTVKHKYLQYVSQRIMHRISIPKGKIYSLNILKQEKFLHMVCNYQLCRTH